MLSFSFAVECTPSSNSRKRQIMIWQQNGDYKISIAAEHSDRFICLYIHAFYNECVYTQYVYMHESNIYYVHHIYREIRFGFSVLFAFFFVLLLLNLTHRFHLYLTSSLCVAIVLCLFLFYISFGLHMFNCSDPKCRLKAVLLTPYT